MSAALAIALTLFVPQQTDATHEQAVHCTGVFLYAYAIMAQIAENEPTADNAETAAATVRLLKVADDDRLAAARREGISIEASGQRFQIWLSENSEATAARDLESCLGRYEGRLTDGA